MSSPTGDVRKTVTVLFADVTGSTSLGEQLDPESMRRVMGRWFDAVQGAIDLHGGTVEKFVGDAVMAVFGIPVLHEDDALRAVRAAAALQERLAALNEELERDFDVRLGIRTGVNTGEVVAGEGQTLVTGDAVNVAARLEQAAQPGEVLLGPQTERLVRHAVRTESVAPLELKGKREPVTAWRLLEALPDVPAFTRRINAPFVGRQAELDALLAEFDRCAAERSCRLATILGEAGIGKSRLARELVGAVEGRARVLIGRCLAYGDGITYWPLVEIARQLGGTDPRSAIAEELAGDETAELVADRIAAAVGAGGIAGPSAETHWAVRRLFERVAAERPLVVVLDDLHWAEPTLLDLVDYLVAFLRDAPVLLVGIARAELLDARPAWTAARPEVTTIALAPLAQGAAELLVDELMEGAEFPVERRSRVVEAAEGNPLFVEQMLAMQSESQDELAVPPTIQALLAARIDRLPPEERTAAECGSIEGRLFHREAVATLAGGSDVGVHLLSLVRKQLVRPDRALFAGDDAFRFAHILVRDAVYAAVPKGRRAELHEAYADWLEERDTSEFDEILGYHLEQAYRYRLDLGPSDERAAALGARAGAYLGAAGRRASERADVPAARTLVERALEVLPADDVRRDDLQLLRARVLREAGDLQQALTTLEDLLAHALETGNRRAEWQARIAIAPAQMSLGIMPADAADIAERAIDVFAELGDDDGLMRALHVKALMLFVASNTAAFIPVQEKALRLAERLGDEAMQAEMVFWLFGTYAFGGLPVAEALERCRAFDRPGQGRLREAALLHARGILEAVAGSRDGPAEVAASREIWAELGMKVYRWGSAVGAGEAASLLGDWASAEEILREGCRELAAIGEKALFSTAAAMLADALFELGRDEEADAWSRESEATTAEGDVVSEVGWRVARARVLARAGDVERAEILAREAIETLEPTDQLRAKGDAARVLAEVLTAGGRVSEAAASAERALAFYEERGVVVLAERTRAMLAELTRTAGPAAR